VVNRPYDILVKPEVKEGDEVKSYAQFAVYLPLSDAPEKTPEQEAGLQPPSLDEGTEQQAPASSGTAAAPASAASAGK
jgi:hypothetical protein